jgi:WD40 repeat protein
MKKFGLILLFFALTLYSVAAQQKYALVIGNGAYTGITRLNNPVNDATDISAALRGLGFTVDLMTNAGRVQMEEAVTRLKNRLSAERGSYGLFYYAGHGVQSGGENYLIPVDANIPSEAYLRDRSVSMSAALDELNAAGNTLNIIVLDACRDNPFGWRRSGTRGLQVVTNQPADSIIVYATSAGSTATDGTGRNGLFTTHLLNNLKKPGLSVRDMFDQTGADVRRASSGAQIPAIYSQFFDVAYLGTRPAAVTPTPSPQPRPAAVQPVAPPVLPAPEAWSLVRTLSGHSDWVYSVAYSPDGRRLVSGAHDNTIKIWDAETGALIRTFSGHNGWVLSVAYSPNGRWLASSGTDDKTIKIWDAETGALIRTLSGHTRETVRSVVFSPDGRRLASSGAADNTVKIWDAETGALIRTLSGHTSVVYFVAFSPNGRQLASAARDETVKIWNTETGALIRTLSGYGDEVLSVAFSPDGRQLASGSYDKTVKIWDAETGVLLRTLSGHIRSVNSVVYSPDSRWLASGSYDKTVKIWATDR